jgi:hypothetical protein
MPLTGVVRGLRGRVLTPVYVEFSGPLKNIGPGRVFRVDDPTLLTEEYIHQVYFNYSRVIPMLHKDIER